MVVPNHRIYIKMEIKLNPSQKCLSSMLGDYIPFEFKELRY